MNEKTRLFDVQPDRSLARPRGAWIPAIETPAARRSDPETSHVAAEEITGSGDRASHQRAVVDLVRRHPGLTAGELAKIQCEGLPRDLTKRYHAIQRRVSEMSPRYILRGEARKCSESRRMATTLWPAEGGRS